MVNLIMMAKNASFSVSFFCDRDGEGKSSANLRCGAKDRRERGWMTLVTRDKRLRHGKSFKIRVYYSCLFTVGYRAFVSRGLARSSPGKTSIMDV